MSAVALEMLARGLAIGALAAVRRPLKPIKAKLSSILNSAT